MLDFESIERYLDLIIRAIPLLSIFFLLLKPVRKTIGRWISEAITYDVRIDMNAGFKTINDTLSATKVALTKSESLQSRRHRSNQREIKKIEQIGEEVKKRMDDHLIDHGKEKDVPNNIP